MGCSGVPFMKRTTGDVATADSMACFVASLNDLVCRSVGIAFLRKLGDASNLDDLMNVFILVELENARFA